MLFYKSGNNFDEQNVVSHRLAMNMISGFLMGGGRQLTIIQHGV
jgi:hypothetical protein